MNEPIVIDGTRLDINLQEVYDSIYPPEAPKDWHGVIGGFPKWFGFAFFAAIALLAVFALIL